MRFDVCSRVSNGLSHIASLLSSLRHFAEHLNVTSFSGERAYFNEHYLRSHDNELHHKM